MTNAALAVTDSLAPAAPRPERRRRRLTLVPGLKRRRFTGALVSLVLLVVVAVASILAINISVSRQQYSVVSLRAQQADLESKNGALNESIENNEAPQTLAAKARKLGMVYSSSFGVVDVNTGKISGNPKPTTGNENIGPDVPAPLAPKTRAAVAPTVEVKRVKESQSSMEGRDLNGGTVPAPSQKKAPEPKKAEKKPASSAPGHSKKN